MKKNILVFAAVFFTGIGLWVFMHRSRQVVQGTDATNSLAAQQSGSGAAIPQGLNQQARSQSIVATSLANSNALMDYVKKRIADPGYDGKQPINFYGRVVDESNVVVASANIHFTWNDNSEKGTSNADVLSDNNGGFSLIDRHGKYLYVTVGKQGYYSGENSRGSGFEYANPADGLFTPDAGNPVVFHLRKKGVGVDLITSQSGMPSDFPIHIPHDGTPIKVDFLQRIAGDSGQMQITEIKPEFSNWKQATNWMFRMEIADGGFVEQNDEFQFQAPAEGYQTVVEFNFQKDQPDWAEDIKKDYYIKFGNPPRYGRLNLNTSILMGGAILTYAINPDGSRNLEPK